MEGRFTKNSSNKGKNPGKIEIGKKGRFEGGAFSGFNFERNLSEKKEIIGKMEAAAKNQRERLKQLESLRDRWKEAIEVPSMIEGCHKEIKITEEDIKILKEILRNIENKSRKEQKKYLLENQEFLQEHGDIQRLVQKKLNNKPKKWYQEQFNLVSRYKSIMAYTRERRENFIDYQVNVIEESFSVKIDINSFYNSLEAITINMEQPSTYVEMGNNAKKALEILESKREAENGKSEKEIVERKRKQQEIQDEIIGRITKNDYGLLTIAKMLKEDSETFFQAFKDSINGTDMEKRQKDIEILMEKLQTKQSREYGEIKEKLTSLSNIYKEITKHTSMEKYLESDISMLEQAINFAERANSEQNRVNQMESEYESFQRKYASIESLGQSLSDEDGAQRRRWFETACALYEKRIAREKGGENTKIDLAESIKEAKFYKEGILCYQYAISCKNESIKGNGKALLVRYILSRNAGVAVVDLKDNEEYKKACKFFDLLQQKQERCSEIENLFSQVKKLFEEKEDIYKTRCDRNPNERKIYVEMVKKTIKGRMEQFKQMVHTDLLFAKIINVCEARQNEFSDALKELVYQQEETIASKREQIDHLQLSLEGLSTEIRGFIQQCRPEAATEMTPLVTETASVKEPSIVALWLDEGSSLFEEAESTNKQGGIEPWLKLGHTLLTQELAETQKKLIKQKEGLQTKQDVSVPTDANTSHSTGVDISSKEEMESFLMKKYSEQFNKKEENTNNMQLAKEGTEYINRFALACRENALKATVRVMVTLKTHLGNLYKDAQGKLIAQGKPEQKITWKGSGELKINGKLQKDYVIPHLSPGKRVLGIKAQGFGANTPMLLGGNEDLEHLATEGGHLTSGELNIRALTESNEVMQESQGKLHVKAVKKGMRDHFKSMRDYEMRFRSVEVEWKDDATYAAAYKEGSHYFPLDPKSSKEYDPRFEMRGLFVLDYDDLKRDKSLNFHSDDKDIKRAILEYCAQRSAIKDGMEYEQFLNSETSNVIVADFRDYLQSISKYDGENFLTAK